MKIDRARLFLLLTLLPELGAPVGTARADNALPSPPGVAARSAVALTAEEERAKALEKKTQCEGYRVQLLNQPVDAESQCRPDIEATMRSCATLLLGKHFNDALAARAFLEPIYKLQPCPSFACNLVLANRRLADDLKEKIKEGQIAEKNCLPAAPQEDAKCLPFAQQLAALEPKIIKLGEICLDKAKVKPDYRASILLALPRSELRQRATRLQWAGISLLGFVAPSLIIGSSILARFDMQPTGRTDCTFAGMQQPCLYNFQGAYIAGFTLAGVAIIAGGVNLYYSRETWKKYRAEVAPSSGVMQ